MNKKIIISLTCLLFSCNLILFFAYLFTPNDNLNKPNYIELQDINNEKIYSYNHAYQGDYVYLKDVSNCFIKTLINTEDKNFYSHHDLIIKELLLLYLTILEHLLYLQELQQSVNNLLEISI